MKTLQDPLLTEYCGLSYRGEMPKKIEIARYSGPTIRKLGMDVNMPIRDINKGRTISIKNEIPLKSDIHMHIEC